MAVSMSEERLERLRAELQRMRAIPPVRSPMVYVGSIFGLTMLGVIGVGIVLYLRPPPADNAPIIAVIIGLVAPTITALLGMMIKDVHVIVNSRMTELLLATENAAGAEGEQRGRAFGKAEEKVDEGAVRVRETEAAANAKEPRR